MTINEPDFIKAEQGEGEKDHSIIYLASNGDLWRYVDGNWNWRTNNPGNIHAGKIGKRHNQIGIVNKGNCRNLAIFPKPSIGKEAMVDCLNSYYMNFSTRL